MDSACPPIVEIQPLLCRRGMFSSAPTIALYNTCDKNGHIPAYQSHHLLHVPPVKSQPQNNGSVYVSTRKE